MILESKMVTFLVTFRITQLILQSELELKKSNEASVKPQVEMCHATIINQEQIKT